MRPPTHGIDDTAEYVDITDPAWDWERLKDEQKRMEEAGEDPKDHPVVVYMSGDSRFSLDATGVVLGESKAPREYLKDPTIWELRRLDRRQYRSIQTLYRRDELEKANEEAVRFGLDKAHGPLAPKLVGGDGLDITDKDLDAIWSMDSTLIDRLAGAVVQHSRPLSASEGKR